MNISITETSEILVALHFNRSGKFPDFPTQINSKISFLNCYTGTLKDTTSLHFLQFPKYCYQLLFSISDNNKIVHTPDILYVICFIKIYKDFAEKEWTSIIVTYCNRVLFKQSVINMGISLYNKDLKSFLLWQSFCSVD
jgi:hypothetical protein